MKGFIAISLGLALAVVSTAARQRPTGPEQDLRRLIERYAAGDPTAPLSVGTSGQFTAKLDSEGRRWVEAAPGGEREARRNVLAVLALELAASPQVELGDGLTVVEWACGILRSKPLTDFGRLWIEGSVAALRRTDLERTAHPDRGVSAHLQHGFKFVPNDPLLQLASLLERPETFALTARPVPNAGRLAEPLLWRAPRGSESKSGPGRSRIDDTMRKLGDLVPSSVGAEASLHLGMLEFSLRQLPQAIGHLDTATQSDDPFIRNLSHLYKGLLFDEEGSTDAATTEYRAAVDALPGARSSAVALAGHLILAGKRDEAASVLDDAYDRDPPAVDPWRRVVAFDRLWPVYLQRLRILAHLPARPTERLLPERASVLSMTREPVTTPIPEAQRPVSFRATASGVSIDVSVTSGRLPLTDLTASDFEVFDKGVRQSVTVSRVDEIPVDLSMVISFVVKRGGGSAFGSSRVGPLKQTVEDAAAIAAFLRPTDRLRLIQIDGDGREIWPLQPATGALPPFSIGFPMSTYGRFDDLYDAVGAALFRSSPANRRHVVIVFSDGIDAASVLTPTQFLAAARQAEPVMYLIGRNTGTELAAAMGSISAFTTYADLFWPPEPKVIEEAAAATGGSRYFNPNGFVANDFKKIIDQFRQSYVVRYQVSGVPAAGWHDVTIRITRPGRFDVRYRNGYQAEER